MRQIVDGLHEGKGFHLHTGDVCEVNGVKFWIIHEQEPAFSGESDFIPSTYIFVTRHGQSVKLERAPEASEVKILDGIKPEEAQDFVESAWIAGMAAGIVPELRAFFAIGRSVLRGDSAEDFIVKIGETFGAREMVSAAAGMEVKVKNGGKTLS